ncbi:MAG: SGNH/GDSL hydrolase family protein [Luteolibacter sp.]
MTRLLLLIGTALLAAPAGAQSIVHEGDHIAIVGNTFADQLRNHGNLETLLQQHSDISLRNLGWAGDTLTHRDRPTNFPTEETTLTEHKTDLIIASFGMSESFAGEKGIATFQNDLKAFIASHESKKYNGKTPPRLVFISPIAYEHHGVTTPDFTARNTDLAAYAAAMRETAAEENIPFIDLYAPTRAMMDEAGETKFTTNGIHLTPLGYWSVSHIIASQLLEKSSDPWKLTIDAKSNSGTARGAAVSKIETDRKNLSFSVEETTPASPPPPTEVSTPAFLNDHRDSLIIQNLDPGEYTLSIEGQKIATANHEEWAMGVVIDNSPAHQEAEQFRAAVNDKNLQFLYNWKALNQVHIVGERKRSPSGKSLPSEQEKFNELAKEQEASLRKPREPKTRQWKLTAHGL